MHVTNKTSRVCLFVCFLQVASRDEKDASRLSSHLTQLETTQEDLQRRLKMAEEELQNEGAKVAQLEGEIITIDIVREGMQKELEKVEYAGCSVCVWF